jgi:hypothetical protein
MTDLLIRTVKETIENKGYEWFDGNRPFNVNLVGVRNHEGRLNFFDDYMFAIYRD